jgi:hypothetical protein
MHGGPDELKVEISASSGRYDFTLDNSSDVKLLKQVYGDRVRSPFTL